jgi:transcriptional regulator with XRE-family HTH domain
MTSKYAETVPKLGVAKKRTYVTEGHRLICELPQTVVGIAKRLAVNQPSVSQWRSGHIAPGVRMRDKIERTYKIPAASWDRVPLGAVPSQPDNDNDDVPDEDEDRDTKPATDDDADSTDLDIQWRRLIKAINKQLLNPNILARERMALHEQLTKALEKRRRFQREREMLEDRTIREHPKWQRLKNELTDALLPFPEAARAVEAVIVRLLGSGDDNRDEDDL